MNKLTYQQKTYGQTVAFHSAT